MVSHECCYFFISPSTVLGQVLFVLLCFRLSSGVWCRALLVMLSCSLASACPVHILLKRIVSMFYCLRFRSSFSFEIFFGQNILRIVWKTNSLLRPISISLELSGPYSSLVLMLYCLDLLTSSEILNAFLTLRSRFLTSLSAPALVTVLPK